MRFVATSFWVALQFRRDMRHELAAELWNRIAPPLLTTNHVLGETWSFLRRRLGHNEAAEFVSRARRTPGLVVQHVDDALEVDAWNWLRRHDERPYSFVDATSFVVMRRRRIREALAFDDDFGAAGFVELRP